MISIAAIFIMLLAIWIMNMAIFLKLCDVI